MIITMEILFCLMQKKISDSGGASVEKSYAGG